MSTPAITARSWYSPRDTLNSSVTGGFGAVSPAGGGGLNLEEWYTRLKNDKVRAQAQADAMKAFGDVPEDPLRRFMMVKGSLDYMRDPKEHIYGFNSTGVNSDFMMFPAASALTFGHNVFPSGWDTLAKLTGAAGGVDPTAQAKADLFTAQADAYRSDAAQPRR